MFKTLRLKIFLVVAGTVFLTTITIAFLIQREIRTTLLSTQDENARNLLDTIVLNVENEYKSLVFHKKSVLERRNSELKNITTLAIDRINEIYLLQQKGILSEREAKNRAMEEVKRMRYDDDVGYLWINDTGRPIPRMIMHPTLPELDGEILNEPRFDCALGMRKNLFVAFVDVSLEKGEGYVDYLWPKPTREGLTDEQPKISYVKLFKEWNWVIGTGVYIDDIEAETQKRLDAILAELQQTFAKVKVAQTGYMFIFNGHKEFLIHPTQAGTDGSRLLNPKTKQPILDELIESSKRPQVAFEYMWNKPAFQDEYQFLKRSYTVYYQPLDWYITVSYYHDEIEIPGNKFRIKVVYLSGIFILIALAVSFLFSKSITDPINEVVKASTSIASGNFDVSLSRSSIKEIDSLSLSLVDTGNKLKNLTQNLFEEKEQLRESEERFRFLAENMADIVWTLDRDFKTTYVSLSIKKILGFTPEERKLQTLEEMVTPESQQRLIALFVDELQSDSRPDINPERHVTVEVEYYHAQGHTVWMENSVKAFRDESGEIIGMYGSSRDITGRKRAERKIIEAMQFNEEIIAKSPIGMSIYDESGQCIAANKAIAEITGVTEEQVLKQNYRTLEAWRISGLLEMAERTLLKKAPQRKEVDGISAFGKKVVIDCQLVPLQVGKHEYLLFMTTDMTEHKKMQEMMVQSEKMLSIGGLAAGMAHEINNPLAGMIQTANVVSDRLSNLTMPANERAAERLGISMEVISSFMQERNIIDMLGNIRSAGIRAAEIVANMLSFARKSDSTFSSCDLVELFDHTIDIAGSDYDLKKKFDFRRIKIIREFEKDLPLVPCEPGKIQQVILNILRNGAEAMQDMMGMERKPQFVLRLLLEKAAGWIRIEIEDNGPGMNKATSKRIFEPFFTTKPTDRGTGLGLSVSYFIIVENHKGEMSVESNPGKGARFIIRLPLERKST
ncbi:cache domain-containing protein [bacterium]|nr:cache domain-containing protein [bacterium]